MSKQGDREQLARETGFADPNEVAVYNFLRGRGFGHREAQDILAGRAALRSDSPVGGWEGSRRKMFYDTLCAINFNLRRGEDPQTNLHIEDARILVQKLLNEVHPASTGGERDEPEGEWAQHLQDTYDEGKAAARRELEQTPSYIHGFNAGFDEAVKQLSEECIVCDEPYLSHCEMDEPGVDHPSSCGKKHHEFQGSGDNDG